LLFERGGGSNEQQVPFEDDKQEKQVQERVQSRGRSRGWSRAGASAGAMGFGGGKGSMGLGGAETFGVLRLRLRMTPLLKKVVSASARARARATAKATATARAEARAKAKAKARAKARARAKAKAKAKATASASANAGILHYVQNDGVGGVRRPVRFRGARCGLEEAGAGGVGGDLGVDFERQGEGGAAGGGGDAGLRAVADGVEEVFEFEAERFAFRDAGLLHGQASGGMGNSIGRRTVDGGDGMGHTGG
jgi:hypothetical protein